MQLAARERGLEHVAGVHRAFGLAGADHRVQLVDEEDDAAFLLGQVVEHGLEPLLELAAELRARDQRAHVEREHALVAQALRHLAVDDALREAFDDGRLADAGLADQHRIVLRAPLQHLDHAADFLVAADHRIELALLRARGQVDRVFLERLALVFGAFRLHLLAAAHLLDRGLELRLRRAGRFQCAAELAAIVERRQHEKLARDERIAALLRELVGHVQQTIEIVRDVDVAFLPGHFRQPVEDLPDAGPQRRHVDAGLREQRHRRAALLIEQRRHQMRGLEHVVVAPDRKRLRIGERLLETRRELVHTHACFTLRSRRSKGLP